MEIESSRIPPSATVSGNEQGTPVEKSGKTGANAPSDTSQPAAEAADRVSLTGDAQRLRELEASIANQPVVDNQRVNTVRDAVENGTFTVNAERIAEKIMSLEQAITGAR